MPLTPMAAPRRPKRAAFPQPAFRGAAGDLKSMFSNMDRRRWLFLALAFAMTFTVLFGFLLDSDFRKLGPGEQIIYVENWRANRSAAEIPARQRREPAVTRQPEEERRPHKQKEGKVTGNATPGGGRSAKTHARE